MQFVGKWDSTYWHLESMIVLFSFIFILVVVVTFAYYFVLSILSELSVSVCPICIFLFYSGYNVW